MVKVNRITLAKIRGCKDGTLDGSPLQGAACTNACDLFNECNIRRTPLLVQTLSIKVGTPSMVQCDGLFVTSFDVVDVRPEEYTNALIDDGVKQG